LSNGAPKGIKGRSETLGFEHLRAVDEVCKPFYHLYRHHEEPIEPGQVGSTQCFGLNDVSFEQRHGTMIPFGLLKQGCMGVLKWATQEEHLFDIVQEPPMQDMTWSTWLRM